jgi:hypothetical protein
MNKKEPVTGPAARPRGLICYICGREYGTLSLEIHLKTCKKKWDQEEAKKPAKERRPVPEAPENFHQIGSDNRNGAVDSYNEEAFKNYNEKALVPCPNCARTFLPDSLNIHLKSCKPKHVQSTPALKNVD